MKVTTERLENCIVKLDIQVDDKETHNYLHDAARTMAKDYRVPGFRPGKAPYHVVMQRFGLEAIRVQVIEQFGDQVFEAGLKESGLEPVDQASLEEVTWDPFTLHLTVPVAPAVNLGGYRDIRIDWEEPSVSDQDLEEELDRLRRQHGEWQEAGRGAELGDQIVIDITGKVEDKVVLGNTEREMVLNADSPYPIPGFAEQIVGMKVDETREFDLTYPEDHYNPDTAGKSAHFEATLHKIQVETLPELNDEFAILVG
ncbi:trigger factor, partial [candidate division KSB1 bacterium]